MKEGMHIKWIQPKFNKQVKHQELKKSVFSCFHVFMLAFGFQLHSVKKLTLGKNF